jgi:hypothetical protein
MKESRDLFLRTGSAVALAIFLITSAAVDRC